MRLKNEGGARDENLRRVLRKYWGFDTFRPRQEEIIRSVLEGKDTLALLPTGGGKSLCFQLPALVLPGVCLVVSPLIALMEDQVENLHKKEIPAACITGSKDEEEIRNVLQAAISGTIKLLYVAPERLESVFFRAHLKQMNISMLVIDEAHCLSQWGFDFRPSYLKIADLRALFPQVPVLALTATATEKVSMDIMLHLGFRKKNLISMSFERTNLIYAVRYAEDKATKLSQVLSGLIKNDPKASGIVYAGTRKGVEEYASNLNAAGFRAYAYHAGMTGEERSAASRAWMSSEASVMVATTAFGMGIDRPDVRFVIHVDLPDSPEAYYQEAGRAGRDGETAYAIVIYNESDHQKLRNAVETEFPPEAQLRRFYGELCRYLGMNPGRGSGTLFRLNLFEFARQLSMSYPAARSALRQICRAGYFEIRSDQEWKPALVQIIADPDSIYDLFLTDPQESVLEALIRSGDGMFDQLCRLNESWLASRLDMDTVVLQDTLRQLHYISVIQYIPAQDAAEILMVWDAVPQEEFSIARSEYERRKEQKSIRMEAVWSYVSTQGKCRSKMILSYFGEWSAKACGKCDVCLARKREDPAEKAIRKAYAALSPVLDQLSEIGVQEIQGLWRTEEVKEMLTALCDRKWLICKQNGKFSKGKF